MVDLCEPCNRIRYNSKKKQTERYIKRNMEFFFKISFVMLLKKILRFYLIIGVFILSYVISTIILALLIMPFLASEIMFYGSSVLRNCPASLCITDHGVNKTFAREII